MSEDDTIAREDDDAGVDREECTIMQCSGDAKYAYWMPDLGEFSKVRNPTHDLLEDGDLSPYVCESCRDRMASSPHWTADRFVRPEEKLVTDGGRDEYSMACYDCERKFRRSDIEMHEVPVEHKDKSGYRFVPVPICHECALRRFGIKCDHCGEYHEDVEAVFECKRDRPGLIPDGGQEDAELYQWGTPLSPSDESPQLKYCHTCVSDTLHSWNGESWICETCGGRWSA